MVPGREQVVQEGGRECLYAYLLLSHPSEILSQDPSVEQSEKWGCRGGYQKSLALSDVSNLGLALCQVGLCG